MLESESESESERNWDREIWGRGGRESYRSGKGGARHKKAIISHIRGMAHTYRSKETVNKPDVLIEN